MSHYNAILLGFLLATVGTGLVCGHYLEDGATWPLKLGIILVSGIVGAALGRVAFEKR